METNKERLEAWLFSQPDEREWNYTSNTKCVICSLVKETTSHNRVSAVPDRFGFKDAFEFPIPDFALRLLRQAKYDYFNSGGKSLMCPLIATNLKTNWRKLFPETQEPVAVKVGEKVL